MLPLCPKEEVVLTGQLPHAIDRRVYSYLGSSKPDHRQCRITLDSHKLAVIIDHLFIPFVPSCPSHLISSVISAGMVWWSDHMTRYTGRRSGGEWR